MTHHPTSAELQGFISGDIHPRQAIEVANHIANGCSHCRASFEVYAALAGSMDEAEVELPEELDALYERAIDSAYAFARRHNQHARKEGAGVGRIYALLEESGATGLLRGAKVHRLASYWALIDYSKTLRYEDPAKMIDVARLALIVAEQLDPVYYGAAQVADFQCRAAIELANAYRVADQLDEAEKLLGEAAELLARGTREPFLEARLFDIEASLLADRRSFDAAREALDTVFEIYRSHGEAHLAGRALVSKGLYTDYSGDPEKAIDYVQQGLNLVDPRRDPVLVFAAVHNQARCLMASGNLRQARVKLWENLQRWGGAIGRLNKLKLRWLEAQINAGMGEFDRAERTLLEVRQGFREVDKEYHSALVNLELAVIAFKQGHARQARAWVLEAAEVFSSLDIPRESMAAVLLLEKAFQSETATLALLEEMYKFLTKAEAEPNLSLKAWLSNGPQA